MIAEWDSEEFHAWIILIENVNAYLDFKFKNLIKNFIFKIIKWIYFLKISAEFYIADIYKKIDF
jgi:uncharacterized protein YaaR (DUF327 family)